MISVTRPSAVTQTEYESSRWGSGWLKPTSHIFRILAPLDVLGSQAAEACLGCSTILVRSFQAASARDTASASPILRASFDGTGRGAAGPTSEVDSGGGSGQGGAVSDTLCEADPPMTKGDPGSGRASRSGAEHAHAATRPRDTAARCAAGVGTGGACLPRAYRLGETATFLSVVAYGPVV